MVLSTIVLTVALLTSMRSVARVLPFVHDIIIKLAVSLPKSKMRDQFCTTFCVAQSSMVARALVAGSRLVPNETHEVPLAPPASATVVAESVGVLVPLSTAVLPPTESERLLLKLQRCVRLPVRLSSFRVPAVTSVAPP